MNRRLFLKNIARGAIVLGFGVVTGIVLSKKENTSPCDYNFLCNNCKRLSDCKLQEALRYKHAQRTKS